jgi:hypothetical protein
VSEVVSKRTTPRASTGISAPLLTWIPLALELPGTTLKVSILLNTLAPVREDSLTGQKHQVGREVDEPDVIIARELDAADGGRVRRWDWGPGVRLAFTHQRRRRMELSSESERCSC